MPTSRILVARCPMSLLTQDEKLWLMKAPASVRICSLLMGAFNAESVELYSGLSGASIVRLEEATGDST